MVEHPLLPRLARSCRSDRLAARTVTECKVFDRSVTLDRTADAYRAMDERTALKVLIRP